MKTTEVSAAKQLQKDDHEGNELNLGAFGKGAAMASPIDRGDQNPATHQLRQVQASANASPQIGQLRSLQAAANSSAQVHQLRSLQHAVAQQAQKGAQGTAPLPRTNNTGLPDQLRTGLESLSGISMDDVKVHYNSAKPADLQAHAYAQGSDIHIAPGQEQHLAHEAWHVVQQKQGRVQATKQLKGKAAINDDAGLEHEADVMGAKAMQMVASKEAAPVTNGAPSKHAPIVQRFQVREAPEDEKIYSQSDNGNMVTGMETPNHDFYVRHSDAFPVMNDCIKDSPLELFPRNKRKLFGKNMHSVGARYKTHRLVDEGRKEKIKQGTVKKDFFESKDEVNLQILYEQEVLPYIKEFRETIADRAKLDLDSMGLAPNVVKSIRMSLYDLVGNINLFKNVLTAELANSGEFDEDAEGMAAAGLLLVENVEDVLYNPDLTKQDLQEAKQSLLSTWFDEDNRDSPNLISKILYRILDGLSDLIRQFPDDQPIDMMPFHRYNFNTELIQKLYSPDNLVLYRACDVHASTLLGNKITPENQHQLKGYSAGQNGNGELHYATKILVSGNDWVTFEHFAASVREHEVSGVGNQGKGIKNLDHTWQFLMQGVQPSTQQDFSDQDKYFEIYTKIRYYLKGLVRHQTGSFNDSIRDRTQRENHRRYMMLGGNGQLANVLSWRAFYGRVVDDGQEEELLEVLNTLEYKMRGGDDPLVHAKESWDQLVSLVGEKGD
jgi:hypothetical protein